VVMTGSNCAFGHGYRISDRPFPIKYLPLDEEHPTDVEDSYSYSKLAGEELLAAFSRAFGVRTYITRPGGICPPERLQRMAAQVTLPTAWSPWMWGYVPSEDLAEMQRLILEQSDALPPHAVFVANGLDTTLMEPTREVVARLRPDLLPMAEGLVGHQALFSTTKAQLMLGWTPGHTWRDYL
jgi:UDP-glucose 4-epimerase